MRTVLCGVALAMLASVTANAAELIIPDAGSTVDVSSHRFINVPSEGVAYDLYQRRAQTNGNFKTVSRTADPFPGYAAAATGTQSSSYAEVALTAPNRPGGTSISLISIAESVYFFALVSPYLEQVPVIFNYQLEVIQNGLRAASGLVLTAAAQFDVTPGIHARRREFEYERGCPASTPSYIICQQNVTVDAFWETGYYPYSILRDRLEVGSNGDPNDAYKSVVGSPSSMIWTNTVYMLHTLSYASVHSNNAPGDYFASAYADPTVEIDPTFSATRPDLKLQFSRNYISGAVPEPSTWAMLLIGFFGLGSVVRARRQQLSAA